TNTTTNGINKYGMYITSTGNFVGSSGTATNNYGLYVDTPTGADNNYAAIFAGGNVGIGTAEPLGLLHVEGVSQAATSTTAIIAAYSSDSGGGIDLGGSLVMGGNDGVMADRGYGKLSARKENGTSGNYAGYLQFSTRPDGGSFAERMRISSTGNVGIGATAPGQKLTVDGTFGILEGGSTPTYHTIFQGGDQAGDVTYTLPTGAPGSNGYMLSSTTAGVMSWVAPGAASIAIGSAVTSSTSGSVFFANASSQLAQDNANFFWNDTSNRLGIGTTSPATALDVRGALNAGDGTNYFSVDSDGDFTGIGTADYLVSGDRYAFRYSADEDYGVYFNSSGYIDFLGDNQALMQRFDVTTGNIFGSGRIGANTATPDARMESLDDTNPQLRLSHTDSTVYTDFQTTSGGDLTVTPSGGDISVVGNILPSANETYNLGSASYRWNDLYLGGETIHLGTSATDEATVSYTSGNILSFDTDSTTNGDIAFFTNDLYLDKSTGYVGIGDATPSHVLDVAGNVGLSTSSYINFGDTDGVDGYGFRDNGGTIQFKHSGGSWMNFSSASSAVTARDFWSFNHFYYNGTSSMDPFFGAAISSGTIGAPTAASLASGNHPGALLISKAASTTTNTGYRIVGLNTSMVIGGGYLFEGVMNVRAPAGGTNTIYLGFHDATTATAPTDGVYFDIVGTTVTGRSRGGGATLATASTYTVGTTDTSWYRFRIVINTAATRADFYIYNDAGTQVWTDYVNGNVGDLPTTTSDLLTAGFLGVNSSTTNTAYEIANLDYMGMGTVAGYDAFTTGGSGLWTVNGSSIYYNAGSVGIGTTSPSQALSVAGTLGVIETGTSPQYYSIFQGGDQGGNITYTLPTAVGGAGQQLTDAAGNGVLSWAAAGSLRELKNIDGVIEHPEEALETLLNTNIYRFHYKEGMGTGDALTEYVGVMADEAGWAMHYGGNVVNPVNTLGYMVLGIQATNKRIDDMITSIAAVSDVAEGNTSVIGMSVLYAPITGMLAADPMNAERVAAALSSLIQQGVITTSFWTTDDVTGRIVPVGSVDMNGNGIHDVTEILGVDDSWSVNRQGLLTVNGLVVRGDIEIGSHEKPSGITLYDEVTGEPYCLKMVAGVMQSLQGTCEDLRNKSDVTVISPDSSTPVTEDSASGAVSVPVDSTEESSTEESVITDSSVSTADPEAAVFIPVTDTESTPSLVAETPVIDESPAVSPEALPSEVSPSPTPSSETSL
ncbi:MAG: hypothetical protein HGA67_04340, partial [Candidatus Yonathbacteria bacterium]|nr:hypothetical protein [Candidatus Yonathbacteria bacterium]